VATSDDPFTPVLERRNLMPLFVPRGRLRPPQPPRIVVLQQDAEGCPQPACRHPSHGGIPVPSRYCGTSQLQGTTSAALSTRCTTSSSSRWAAGGSAFARDPVVQGALAVGAPASHPTTLTPTRRRTNMHNHFFLPTILRPRPPRAERPRVDIAEHMGPLDAIRGNWIFGPRRCAKPDPFLPRPRRPAVVGPPRAATA
jgi:hypothetical protein